MTRTRAVAERFWEKVALPTEPDGCMPWLAAKRPHGYGIFGITRRSNAYPHRLAYAITHGPIPDGYRIDHDCHNRATNCAGGFGCPHRLCCNPSHLVARTQRDNLFASPLFNGNQTECVNGHLFDEANTRIRAEGWRECRACDRDRARVRKRRLRAAT